MRKRIVMNTGEMFLYLKDNPDAEFIRIKYGTLYKLKTPVYSQTLRLFCFPKDKGPHDSYVALDPNEEWELMDKSCTFEEALLAYRNGKTIYCHGEKCNTQMCEFKPGGELELICLKGGILQGRWGIGE